VTAFEDAGESPDGSGFALESYRVDGLAARAVARSTPKPAKHRLDLAGNGGGQPPSARFRLLTTMATWCETCKGELPQLALLRQEFAETELAMVGLPVDEDDDVARLDAYVKSYSPAYSLRRRLSREERAKISQTVLETLRVDVLPASILTDAEGRVLRTQSGVPSVSDIRMLLEKGA
jgi:thiol-disulfide isomerase/thioredoxin